MNKGYWVAHLVVHDVDRHRIYASASTAATAKVGGRFLVRGGASERAEGAAKPRHVVIEFPSYATAVECYHAAEYAAARAA